MIAYSPDFREHVSECHECTEALLDDNFDLCTVGEVIYRKWLLAQNRPEEMTITE